MSVNVNPNYNKQDIRPLEEVVDEFFASLNPVHYIYTDCPCNKRHLSLVPSGTSVMQRSSTGHTSLSGDGGIRIIRADDPYMRVSEQELIAVLWAKVRQLSARLDAIESA